ncbi:MarR family winged helix-turn-helix transcriptional regulator [Hymenobacter profundi]|uniref:MarR family transcriptional regulator n=1 Tax=Hymenobacter profundi TaxID=1982110 RepID=A0ABS6X319_9BACT|nr:MarR family transcriptional regulator [Hymenobacter profundi]MBW3129418.1 MarR family transcriptional regulator [Hymenobacter profundi]
MSSVLTAGSFEFDPQLKLEEQTCFQVYALSRLLTKAYQPLLTPLDLTYPQYLVLLLLWEHRELTVKDLGQHLLLDSGTLTPLLKRLAQRGLVSRQRDPHDERSVRITLLPAGVALHERARHIPAQSDQQYAKSPAGLAGLRQELKQLIRRLA